MLGMLNDCDSISASINENEFEVELQTHEWQIKNLVSGLFDVQYPLQITELLGEHIQLPVKASGYDEEDFCLYSIYFSQNSQAQCIQDCSHQIKYDEANNQIIITPKEHGDYLLKIFSLEVSIPIRIIKGRKVKGSGFVYDE